MKRAVRYLCAVVAVILGTCVLGAGVGARLPEPDTVRDVERAQAAAISKPSVDAFVATQAAEANLEALGVSRLREQTGASGLGQVLAVVDTGADPRVFGGSSSQAPERVRDWIDLTGEGAAQLVGEYSPEAGIVNVGEIPLNVGSLRSRSGSYIIGILPNAITSAMGGYREIYFAVSDPDSAGLYNTVTVDTDSDLDFGNEVSLREFRSDRSYTVIAISEERSIGLILSRLDIRNDTVSFGFDLSGHGTGLAALAAGSGVLPGVAPEVQVIVIKALRSDGLGNWTDIQRGVEDAIAAKASVILVGSARQQASEDSEWGRLQAEVASLGIHLVLPVGNAGPGVGTINIASDSDATVLVSGYLPQVSANVLLGGNLTGDGWYPLSSCGPDPEGNRGPSFSAPAVAAVPSFDKTGELVFSLMEGTSVSAGYAAGCLALIRQTQSDATGDLAKPVAFITSGLVQGARELAGVFPVEQGSGRLDIGTAWDILRSRTDHRRMLFVGTWDGSSSSDGIWVRGTAPGAFPIWIDNYAPVARVAHLSAEASWLRMRSDLLLLEPVSQRETTAYGEGEMGPGFYSAEITADDETTAGIDTSFVVSVSIPQQFDTTGKLAFDLGEGSAPVERQFVRVPDAAESLAITLTGVSRGTYFALYNPDGLLVRHGTLEGSLTTRIGLPKSGLWQVCVFSPNGSAILAPVRVDASLEGFFSLNLGATLQSQFYFVRSPGSKADVRPAAEHHEAEWRHRRSFAQETGRSTQMMLPDVGESVDALSVRFGTATGNVLRAYLMYFDQSMARWSEVGRALTTTSGVGEIHLPSPTPGKYTVHIEAYGAGPRAYVELDVNLLASISDTSMLQGLPSSLVTGTSTVEMPLPKDESEPRLLIVLRQSDSRIMGVLERPLIKPDEIPIVQMSEGSDIKTVRAWRRSDLKPVDVLVTVGGTSYQLSGGRVTVPIPDGLYPSLRTREGSRILLVPPGERR